MTVTEKLTALFKSLVNLPTAEAATAEHFAAVETHLSTLDAHAAAETDPATAATLKAVVDAVNAAVPSDAAEPTPAA